MADLLWRACILAQWRERGQTDIALIARSSRRTIRRLLVDVKNKVRQKGLDDVRGPYRDGPYVSGDKVVRHDWGFVRSSAPYGLSPGT